MPSNSTEYRGETVDFGRYRVSVRGGRLHVEARGNVRPWLEKRGEVIYVLAGPGGEMLDTEPPAGLN